MPASVASGPGDAIGLGLCPSCGPRTRESPTVMHVPFGYFPDASGGTEVYVRGLLRELSLRGVAGAVAAPGSIAGRYRIDDVPVYRYPATPVAAAAAAFGGLLDEVRPALVHFHALSPAVNAECAAAARARGLPVVWTYHTPTLSCARGTMMRLGAVPCDGEFRPFRCTACAGHGLSKSRVIGTLLAAVPFPVSALLGRSISGRVGTALGSRAREVRRDAGFRAAMSCADRVIAVCNWVRDVLLVNGIPDERILVSRQGLAQGTALPGPARSRHAGEALRLAYFGRIDPTKGVHVLVEAVASIPDASVRLDVFGIVQAGAQPQMEELRALAKGDPRICFVEPLSMDDVPDAMSRYDAIAVPSCWMETGPLVVLEAFAAGVPVLGSRLGGIAELVRDGVDGLLLPVGNVAAWAKAIEGLTSDPQRVVALRAAVRPPRTMAAVADDMLSVYRSLLDRDCPEASMVPVMGTAA